MAGESKQHDEGADPGKQEGASQGAAQGDPEGGASAQGAASGGAAGTAGEGVKDTHGQPGINKERHDKEVAALQKTIDDLQAKIDDAAKTEKARDELKKEVQEARDAIKEEKLNWQLEKAGCRNIKAARALLDDYDGDVSKLKTDCPYLFEEEKPSGSTGGKPGGAVDDSEKERKRMRKIVGLE